MNSSFIVSGILFPEGPAFDLHQNLWCVEQKGGALICHSNGKTQRIKVGGSPNGIAIDSSGKVWFCDSGNNSIRVYDRDTGESSTVFDRLENRPLNMPNDLAFDATGQLAFTCPGPKLDSNEGYFCVYTLSNKLYKISAGFYYPNGLAFTKDGKQLLVAETGRKRIWIGDWDAEKVRWTKRRIFAHTGGITGPDGMAFDEAGNLYVAIYGSGCIRVFDPIGQHITDIPTPGMHPTNCAFDPLGRWGLVVSEVETGTLVALPVFKKGIL